MSLSKTLWIEKCESQFHELDALIPSEDCHELAAALWDRAGCSSMSPEEAAHLLFKSRLGTPSSARIPARTLRTRP